MSRRELSDFEKFMMFRQMSVEKHIEYLREKKMLLNEISCCGCGLKMVESPKKTIDGRCWTCKNKLCPKYSSTLSIRQGSFFSDFRISIIDIFTVIYLWAADKQFMDVANDFGIQKMMITKIFGKLRALVGKYFVENPIRLGGPGKICQIDESLFVHKTKYNRGRWPIEQVWVFGIVDTSISPTRFSLKIVPNRTRNTLYPIITDVCMPGTTIYSDSWAAYFEIQNVLGLHHEMVNHKLYFVQPETGVNTQTVKHYGTE